VFERFYLDEVNLQQSAESIEQSTTQISLVRKKLLECIRSKISANDIVLGIRRL